MKILIFPFRNLSNSSSYNLSDELYFKFLDIIREDSLGVEVKQYKSYQPTLNLDKMKRKASNLDADILLWGSCESGAHCLNSVCNLKINLKQDFEFTNTKENILHTESFISDISNESLIKPIEFYLYYITGFIEWENYDNWDKSIKLFQKCINSCNDTNIVNSLNTIITLINKTKNLPIANKIPQNAEHVGIKNLSTKDFQRYNIIPDTGSQAYGLSLTPVCVRDINSEYIFLRGLRIKDRPIKFFRAGKMNAPAPLFLVDFFQIFDYENHPIKMPIFIFPYALNNYFIPPKGYTFKMKYILPEQLIKDFN